MFLFNSKDLFDGFKSQKKQPKKQELQDGHVNTRYYAFPSVKNGDLFALKNS